MERSDVKERMIEMLSYPRLLMQNQIAFDECQHGGNYKQGDRQCLECEREFECHWLFGNDECVALDKKSISMLRGSLEFAYDYVDGLIEQYEHDKQQCVCDLCNWSRDAREVLDIN